MHEPRHANVTLPRQHPPIVDEPTDRRPQIPPQRRPASDAAERVTALDGLRGIAALVVVLGHCMLVAPGLYLPPPDLTPGQWQWWALYSPAHLAWGGTEAVYIFFVLSGFVLTLPIVRRGIVWRSYYPKRLVRLYLPVIAAVPFAVAVAAAIPRTFRDGQSTWVDGHVLPLDPITIVRDMALLAGTSWLNGPLWSLRYEVLFSLLLPLYLLAAVKLRRWWPAKLVVLLAVVALGGELHSGPVTYMPMFGVGVLMAVERDNLTRVAQRLSRPGWAALIVAALLLLVAQWIPGPGGLPVWPAWTLSGAALLLFAFLHHPGAGRVGDNVASQWLGRRSFSLYLVHEPIVISVAVLFATTSPALAMAVAVPVSLAVAALFYRLVEVPAQTLANRVGRRARGK